MTEIPKTGEKPALLRQLGIASATALVVSNMAGQGIFTSTGFLAGDLGRPRLVLGIWVVGAVYALLGALCYSELGVNLPRSGGEYVYLTRAFGPTWGFMTGWASFFAGFAGPIAVSALAFADYLGYFFPALRQENSMVLFGSGEWTFRFGGAQAIACTLVAAFTALNCAGVERTARVQNVLTSAKVAVLLAFVTLGLAMGRGNWQHFAMNTERTSTAAIPAQFAVSLFWVAVAYSGWNAATYVAEELREPSVTLPAALGIGTTLVAALYIGLNVVYLYAAPLGELKGKVAVGAYAASRLFGPRVAGLFSALMAMALMSTVNAMVTIGPRVYYAMAKNGAFLEGAARVHPKWHTPVRAILAQGVCTVLLTITPFPQLVIYIGFALNFFSVMSVAALMKMRREEGWTKLRTVSFAYPLLPLGFVLTGLWMTIYCLQLKPLVSLATIAMIAAGAAVYHTRVKANLLPETAADATSESP